MSLIIFLIVSHSAALFLGVSAGISIANIWTWRKVPKSEEPAIGIGA